MEKNVLFSIITFANFIAGIVVIYYYRVGINIKFPYRLKKPVVLRRPTFKKT